MEINCGWPNNGLFPNGWFEGSRTNLNAVITFRCHEGMKFEGEKQQATCRADGKVDTSLIISHKLRGEGEGVMENDLISALTLNLQVPSAAAGCCYPSF